MANPWKFFLKSSTRGHGFLLTTLISFIGTAKFCPRLRIIVLQQDIGGLFDVNMPPDSLFLLIRSHAGC